MILSEISKPNATEALTNAWAGSMTVMKEINPMLGSLDQLAKLLLPGLLKNRMVIIDDLERKHCDLGIAEIMGFINQLTEQYNSRVILIMNTGQLETADQEMWALLCEKIIDHQIILNTTPDEAFDIALECLMKNEEPYPDQYINEVKVACSACDINNIRIIQKIIRVTNRMIAFLLASQPNISDKFIRIAIPSTVLLTAIHYKGIKDGPDSDYVLKYNEYSYRIEQNVGALQRASVEKDINEEDEKKRKDESRWSNLMRSLGIVTGGVYEKQVNAFLTTGTLDEEELNDFVGKSRHEKELTDSREAHRKFLATMVWDVNMSDEDRLREARKVAKKVRLLNEYEVSQFHDKVKIINGGLALANEVVANWISWTGNHLASDFRWIENLEHDLSWPLPKIHEDIKAALEKWSKEREPRLSILEVCQRWRECRILDDAGNKVMTSANKTVFKRDLLNLSGDDLFIYLSQNVVFYKQAGKFSFGASGEAFIAACREVAQHQSKRSEVIREYFTHLGLSSVLIVFDYPRR